MTDVQCKRCGSGEYVKNGMARGKQRYLCRDCGCNFTMTPPRGKPAAMQALAVLLYAMGTMSFGAIARLLRVSDVSVLTWVKKEAAGLPDPEVPADVAIVTLDEMWHFVEKKIESSGYGGPMTLSSGEPWPGLWVGVMMQPLNSFSTRSD
jgi:transposase